MDAMVSLGFVMQKLYCPKCGEMTDLVNDDNEFIIVHIVAGCEPVKCSFCGQRWSVDIELKELNE